MKKLFSFIIALVIVFSTCAVSAIADVNYEKLPPVLEKKLEKLNDNDTPSTDATDKITPALQEKLDAASDSDSIEVWVNYVPKNIIDYEELNRLTDERVGFLHTDRWLTAEQVKEWKATRNVVEDEMIHQYYVDLFDRLGIETEEIIGNWEPDNPVSRNYSKHYILSKAKIMALTDHEEVASIDTYHHQESEPYQPDPTELSPSERFGNFLFAERYFGEDYYSTEYNSDTGYDPDWVFYDELYYQAL